MTVSKLLIDEQLDTIDPLRHLLQDSDGLDVADIVPAQPPSIHNQTLDLSFVSSLNGVPNPIVIKLAVDASPGCGGIAWPAGEVCFITKSSLWHV